MANYYMMKELERMKSILFVPATEKMIKKITSIESDAFIIDLEDSISTDMKEEALQNVKNYLSVKRNDIFIRLEEKLLAEEIGSLSSYEFEGYMIPKFENPDDYCDYLDEFNKRKIIALIETPIGMANIERIASCSWVDAIAFGAEDYTSIVGMRNKQELLIGIKNRLVMYCKAYEKQVIDTPCFSLNDLKQLKEEVTLSYDLGFDGKLAIHPKQIEIINQVFGEVDIGYMKSIVNRYESENKAVVEIDGKIYEKMHIERIKRIIQDYVNED